MRDFIGMGIKPIGPNFNVINILRTLIEDPECIAYIPHDYVRGTVNRMSPDPKVHFLPSEAGKPMKVVSITSNQERFNFSLLCLIPVMVEKMDEEGKVTLNPMEVYRQYTIIRDSNLTIEYIYAKLSAEAFETLRDTGVLYYSDGTQVSVHHIYSSNAIYKVSFRDVPIISLNWAQPVRIGLYNLLKRDAYISKEVTFLNQNIKKLKAEGQHLIGSMSLNIYQEERTYNPDSSSKSTKVKVPCIVYEVDDPSIDDIQFTEYYDIKEASDQLSKIKSEQKDIRFISRCIIMAIENTKKKGSYEWSDLEKVPRSKDKYRQYATVELPNGESIVLKRTIYDKEIEM